MADATLSLAPSHTVPAGLGSRPRAGQERHDRLMLKYPDHAPKHLSPRGFGGFNYGDFIPLNFLDQILAMSQFSC